MKNLKNMDVVILCGGKGTRMNEESGACPKPMVAIGSKPILWHIMKYYSNCGFNSFILALGYKGGYIKRYLSEHHEKGWRVKYMDTGLNTLKGGRVKRLEPHIRSELFHLTYGDGLANVDLGALTKFHLKHGKTGTVTAVRPPSRFGEIIIRGNRVWEFEEKPQLTEGHINGGFFVFSRGVLDHLTADEKCDLEFGALQKLSKAGELMAYRHEGFWQCMDNIREAQYLNRIWRSGNAPWKIW